MKTSFILAIVIVVLLLYIFVWNTTTPQVATVTAPKSNTVVVPYYGDNYWTPWRWPRNRWNGAPISRGWYGYNGGRWGGHLSGRGGWRRR